MTWNHEENSCPLAAIDRRLGDLHRQWHQAQDAYFDPDAFRVAIQSAIQTTRTVTFILQKNKDIIPEFDEWYQKWRKAFSEDRLMTWMKDARNTIEKQGDLEAYSIVRAAIVASYLENGPTIDVKAELGDDLSKLLKSIPSNAIGDHIRKDGILRVQRRWVENTLPDHELLDAVAIAYGKLAQLVADAHRQMGMETTDTIHDEDGRPYSTKESEGRLPCMIGHADNRTLDVWLANGNPVEFEKITPKIDMTDGPKIAARYDLKPEKIYSDSSDVTEQIRTIFKTARIMFEKDGYHRTIAFVFKDGKLLELRELRPAEHGHKYLMMRDLAHEVQRRAADAMILIGESWSAPADPKNPMMRAVDSPNRRELLSGTAVSKGGEPLHIQAEILRDGDKFALGTTIEERGGHHFAFAPIYEVWKKPIPADWTDAAPDAKA